MATCECEEGGHEVGICCLCGHTHCCHNLTDSLIIEGENELGYKHKFKRIFCVICGLFLSDELISA